MIKQDAASKARRPLAFQFLAPPALIFLLAAGFHTLRDLPRVGFWALYVAAFCLAALLVLLVAAPVAMGLCLVRRQWSQAGGWAVAWALAIIHYLGWSQTMPN